MQSFYINSSAVHSVISLFFSLVPHHTFDVLGSRISSEEQLASVYRMYKYILEWAENISQNVLSIIRKSQCVTISVFKVDHVKDLELFTPTASQDMHSQGHYRPFMSLLW